MQTEQVKNKYNQDIPNKFGRNYEQERWFKNDIQCAGYEMTKAAVKRFALASDFRDCLELGPGHGTWTKELLEFAPSAHYDLLDISSEMLGLVRERFAGKANIDYIENDFLCFEAKKQYDFFFSSRAVEYIPEKAEVVKKIVELIAPKGRGFVITKTPKYLRNKLLGRTVPEFHSGQILPNYLAKLFKDSGCKDIKVYPVTLSWPFWRSARMNLLLCKIFGGFRLNFLSQFFSESYCVVFRKN